MIPQKQFIYFLLDTPTGRAYYRDNGGNVQTLVITAGVDVSLPNAPGNWLDTLLSFIRNTTYHGINRTYSTPMEFVRDAQVMISQLFLLGTGTEVPLTLATFKYNSQPLAGEPQYKLYFKGPLDLTKIQNTVLETLSVNIMEGGVTQLLKSYENTVVQIPCDGSIPENQKVNCDGLLVTDTFFYQITPLNDFGGINNNVSFSSLPSAFINNEADNYGILHKDPNLEYTTYTGVINTTLISNYSKQSLNFVYLSASKITVRVKGKASYFFKNAGYLQLFVSTTKGRVIQLTDLYFKDRGNYLSVTFDQTIDLDANEGLFVIMQVANTFHESELIQVLSGNFSLSFASSALPTRVWGITLYDMFKLVLKQICLLASTTDQTFNYEAISALLAANLNIMITSGDALRASGDSTYQRFFSITQTNGILQTSFGPVIKITLKILYECVEAVFVAALGNGHNGTGETLYLEDLEKVYDSSAVSFSIGEVAGLKWKYAEDLGFSDFEIGYEPQTYDQKAGKYEYNTTLAMKAPIKSFQKKLSKISKIRFDSYGIERLRANIGATTSTTRNDSDSSVFGLNADPSKWVYDFFDANFTSQVPDPDDANTTNQVFQKNVSAQQIQLPITDGEYFQPNLDQAVIVFSDPAYGFGTSEACTLTIDGLINSVNKPPLAPTDTFTLKLWHNGLVIYQSITPVTGINTPISISQSFTELFSPLDCIYVTMETTATGEVNINTADLAIGTYVTLSAANIPVDPGTSQKLLSWGTIVPVSKPYTVGTSVVQYGFQYFVFNSIVPNTNFKLEAGFQGYIGNQVGNFAIQVYINGVLQPGEILVNGLNTRAQFSASIAAITRDYTLNDIVFLSASVLNTDLEVSLFSANMLFTSNYIKAYSLKRVQYDYLAGVPNIAKDASGIIRTDIAGAPYNIEDLTPKTLYRKWRNYIMSCFFDQVTGDNVFQTLSKNEYLSRSYLHEVITENSNEPVLGFTRLFYPVEIEVKVDVPITFAENLSQAINAHIHFTFMGNDFYFFPDSLTQKPALNESQTWKGLLSPLNNLVIFANTVSFKIPNMGPNSISCAFASPVQFVPYNQSIADKYHTRNRDTFLFKDQINLWLAKDNYGQPVQIGDPISLQFITRGLDPVAYTVYNCDGSIYAGPTNLTTVASPAISDSYVLWQTVINTTGWPRNNYYIIVTAGIGDLAAVLISEPLSVRSVEECEGTVLCEYKNSFNSQGLVFDGVVPYTPSMRFKGGFDNTFKQKYLGKFYVDQPQDITVLNAIPYETTSLFIGRDSGIPDYVAKKILRMLLMDGCTLDGEGFSLNDGAELEQVFTKGAPMKLQRVEIRPSKNKTGIVVNAMGVDVDASLIVSVNPQSFGPNITNSSGTTETDLIDIVVTA